MAGLGCQYGQGFLYSTPVPAADLPRIAPLLAGVAVTALEVLVAAIQAWVFALLTCIYLNEAVHLHDH